MPARIVIDEVSRCLSTPRLAPYLSAAGTDPELALALYHWNVQLAAAFQEVLAVTEIVVRNAVDAELRVWNPTRGRDYITKRAYPPEWTDLPAAPIAGVIAKPLAQARGYAKRASTGRGKDHARYRAPICHDDVLAQMSFGVWHKLLPPADPAKAGLQLLWSNALQKAFPLAPAAATAPAEVLVHDRLNRLVSLRNRVAHMESLLDVNVPARLSDVFSLLGYISPSTRDWCAGLNRVTEINKARPQP
ncbi:hypothetical protein [Nocardia tengchongensis]|uniref:hypothetical protein n=1 Tax=Nocardia tengchongensis TaxID=2055889 RepID=UPI00368A1690